MKYKCKNFAFKGVIVMVKDVVGEAIASEIRYMKVLESSYM